MKNMSQIWSPVPYSTNNNSSSLHEDFLLQLFSIFKEISKWRKLALGQWESDHCSPVEKYNIMSIEILSVFSSGEI